MRHAFTALASCKEHAVLRKAPLFIVERYSNKSKRQKHSIGICLITYQCFTRTAAMLYPHGSNAFKITAQERGGDRMLLLTSPSISRRAIMKAKGARQNPGSTPCRAILCECILSPMLISALVPTLDENQIRARKDRQELVQALHLTTTGLL